MSPLAYTLAAAFAGGVLSTLAAAGTLALHAGWISRLVSFAVGALLGAVFLELLPHALETGSAERVMLTVLVGLLAFFLLEKLVLWRHAHGHETHADDEEESEHDHALHAHAHGHGDRGRSGYMILIGNSVHNFCDGVVIAASFLADTKLGIAATVAIVAHAIPQQVGDFAILLHSGYSRARAFAFNVAAGLATVVGALAGHFALADMQQAAADRPRRRRGEPALRRRGGPDPEPAPAARARSRPPSQMLLIGLGIAVIGGVHLFLAH